jgi:PKHD-type hydroxylase
MFLHVRNVLPSDAVARCREILASAPWADGRITAGSQSAEVKNNEQLPDSAAASVAARAVVLQHLDRNAQFFAAALPRRIFPPLFNRYTGATNAFGNHIDNAVRTFGATGQRVRTDLSATLFLSDPAEYDGGELVIEDTFGGRQVKLPAGDLVLYPASTVHRVEPVKRGTRLASFFWVESMVRDDACRRLLYDLDMTILDLRQAYGEIPEAVRLTGTYHNLLRRWVDV